MKKFYLFLILVWGLICVEARGADQYSCHLQFDKAALTIREDMDGNERISVVSLSDLPLTDNENTYRVPCKRLLISVPFNSRNHSVDIDIPDHVSIPLNYPLQHVLPEQYSSLGIQDEPNYAREKEDSSLERVRIVDSGVMRGFNRVVAVTIYPVLYSEKDMTLDFIEECYIRLNWTLDESLWTTALIPGHGEAVNSSLNDVRDAVVNPESVGTDVFPMSRMQNTVPVSTNEYFQYLIITTKLLKDSFARLIALRKLRGISTAVFCIEDILTDDRFKDGDVISGINDNAGKLRAFLRYVYQNNGTEYVLLAGKYPDMPVRMVQYIKSTTTNGVTVKDTVRYTSDTYFSELDASWAKRDETGTTLQGSLSGSNYNELKIGRLSASKKTEIEAYTDKVFYYELNPGRGNPDYLGNAFVSVSDAMQDAYKSKNRDRYSTIYPILCELFQTAIDYPTGKDVIDQLNARQWGYVDFQGHGNPEGVQTTDKNNIFGNTERFRSYGINALDNERWYLEPETGNGLDNWKNKYYPNWSVSMSCTLSPFVHKAPLTYTFAESYLLGDGYGGVAFMGNTDSGYIRWSNALQDCIFSFLEQCSNSISSPPYAGNIEVIGKETYSTTLSEELMLRHCLSGDPMVNIWCGKPKVIKTAGFGLSVEGMNSSESVAYANRLLGSHRVTKGSAPLRGMLSGWINNAIQAVYRGDLLPFLRPTLISGISFDYSDYFIGGELSFGSAASSSEIVFASGNKLVFEALKDVYLRSTINMQEASECRIISHAKSELEGCMIEGKGALRIKADRVTVNKNTEIVKGVKLIIEPR